MIQVVFKLEVPPTYTLDDNIEVATNPLARAPPTSRMLTEQNFIFLRVLYFFFLDIFFLVPGYFHSDDELFLVKVCKQLTSYDVVNISWAIAEMTSASRYFLYLLQNQLISQSIASRFSPNLIIFVFSYRTNK